MTGGAGERVALDEYRTEEKRKELFRILRDAKENHSLMSASIVVSILTHLNMASFLWDIGKQNSPRCDAAKHSVSSRAILFAQRNFIEKLSKN